MTLRTVFLLILAALTLVTFCLLVDSLMRLHVAGTPAALAAAGTDALSWWMLLCLFGFATLVAWMFRAPVPVS